MNKKPLGFMPLMELTSAMKSGPLNVFANFYWVVTPDSKAVFFDDRFCYPMANRYQEIAQKILKFAPEGSQVEFVPWAYVKFDIADYA